MRGSSDRGRFAASLSCPYWSPYRFVNVASCTRMQLRSIPVKQEQTEREIMGCRRACTCHQHRRALGCALTSRHRAVIAETPVDRGLTPASSSSNYPCCLRTGAWLGRQSKTRVPENRMRWHIIFLLVDTKPSLPGVHAEALFNINIHDSRMNERESLHG